MITYDEIRALAKPFQGCELSRNELPGPGDIVFVFSCGEGNFPYLSRMFLVLCTEEVYWVDQRFCFYGLNLHPDRRARVGKFWVEFWFGNPNVFVVRAPKEIPCPT